MMNSENPRVNVLIANYNYGDWLIDAVNSALDQTYPNLAVTVVDDCSTDDSWNKLYKSLFQNQPHNKFLPSEFDIRSRSMNKGGRDIGLTAIRLNKNSGPSIARNVGIAHTFETSDFYMILDADDMAHKNKVWRMMEEGMKLPGIVGIVYGDYSTINVETGLERIEYKPNFSLKTLLRECIIHSGSLVSKQALEFVQQPYGWYDPELRVCEDYDLWLRITKKFTALHIPESLTRVRVTPNNSSNQVNKEIWQQCMYRVYQKNGMA